MTPNALRARRLVAKLVRVYEPPFPVRLRFEEVEGAYADCKLMCARSRPYFRIRIDPSLCIEAMHLALLHEFAHVLSWGSEATNSEDHDIAWATWHMKVYRTWLEMK
jgi:hypothetical protein